jgi:hypothetical protein
MFYRLLAVGKIASFSAPCRQPIQNGRSKLLHKGKSFLPALAAIVATGLTAAVKLKLVAARLLGPTQVQCA